MTRGVTPLISVPQGSRVAQPYGAALCCPQIKTGIARSLLVASMLAAALTACSNPSTSGANQTIKIGIDLPLSGADASDGLPTEQGALLAIEEANAARLAGGKFTLAPIVLDDTVQGRHDPAAGAGNVKTFIADATVLGVLGPFNSNVAKSEIPLTNDAGLVQISPAVTSDELTVGAGAKALRVSHPDTIAFFRVCTRSSNQGAALAQYARKLNDAKMFVLDDNETYGMGLAASFQTSYVALGGKVLGYEHLTANQQDFKALLTKVKATQPDAIFFGGTTSTGGGLVRRQMGDVGLGSAGYFGGDGISDSEFIATAGALADGSTFTVAAPDADKLATARTFVAAYRARFKQDVGPYSASAYAAAQVLIAAIEKASATSGSTFPTRAAVLHNVAALKALATPIGSVTFNANGDIAHPVLSLVKIVDGKPRTVAVVLVRN